MISAYSQACENNKTPILARLEQEFKHSKKVLEIGSGTGQHAVHFAQNLPHVTWQTSDLAVNHPTIIARVQQANLKSLLPPLTLDLEATWPLISVDAIFTANTLHIVSEALVGKFFAGVNQHLDANGTLCIYGPFNYQGQFTSVSNGEFDRWLKSRDSHSGIRDIEFILQHATKAHLVLSADHAMPANNRLLVFKKAI